MKLIRTHSQCKCYVQNGRCKNRRKGQIRRLQDASVVNIKIKKGMLS